MRQVENQRTQKPGNEVVKRQQSQIQQMMREKFSLDLKTRGSIGDLKDSMSHGAGVGGESQGWGLSGTDEMDAASVGHPWKAHD